jgi:hypothetical protein
VNTSKKKMKKAKQYKTKNARAILAEGQGDWLYLLNVYV